MAVIMLAVLFMGMSRMAATVFVALYALSHVVVLMSVKILDPVERHINKRYYNEAKNILESMPGLVVVGVTGSYGKTSTKHYLTRILTEQFNVLMTPGSYILHGVIRTVREMMQPYTEVFVCEMGAKNVGDIKEICDLVKPQMGIITAVGEQHLESFKVLKTFSEQSSNLPTRFLKTGWFTLTMISLIVLREKLTMPYAYATA